MQVSRRFEVSAVAVIAALPLALFTATARAQYRIDTGRANDANNRIGSGGYNSAHDITNPVIGTSTQVLTGNTTGLSYFHGNSQVFDPNVIETNTNTAGFDAFNAISAPINYAQRSTGASLSQPFYSTATYSPSPQSQPGQFVRASNNVGLTPASPTVQQSSDARLGVVNTENSQSLAAPPGELDLPGQVDINGNRTLTTLSPLYGVRDWRSSDSSDQYFLNRFSNTSQSSLNPPNAADSPISGNSGNSQPNVAGAGSVPGAVGSAIPVSGAPVGGTNTSNAISSQAINGQVNAGPIGSGQMSNLGVTQRVTDLPPPGQQSSQIAALEQRLQTQSQQPMNSGASAQYYNDQLKLRNQIQAQKQAPNPDALPAPGAPAATFKPPGSAMPTPAESAPEAKPPLKPILTGPMEGTGGQPMVITSLATGMNPPELAKTMRLAEEQMRQGKFNDALDRYDAAERSAPNNPFTRLGRGFAELGASYYSRCDADLRRVIIVEPALLAGRYDLNGFLGQDRLQFVTKDLQEILSSEKSNVSAAFLLAFIQHNNGNDQQAAGYLDTARQREGGQPDGVLNLMRKVWNLPPGK